MQGPVWRPLRGVEPARLREARLQSHYAVQWLARAARAFAPPRRDDGHTNLGWDASLAGLVTHDFAGDIRFGFQMREFSLVLLQDEIIESRFDLNGKTDTDTRHWLGEACTARALDAGKLDAPPPYEIPRHPIGEGEPYAVAIIRDALDELSVWYGNANGTLGAARQNLIGQGHDAPAVRCWPHHFDLDCLVTFAKGGGDTGRSMGIGFSPGDHYYDEPYFYVSLYPGPDMTTLPALPAAGHWHDKDFTAAVAPARAILAQRDPQSATEDVVRTAVGAGLALFGR